MIGIEYACLLTGTGIGRAPDGDKWSSKGSQETLGSVSKNADSRHHVQYKFALSCIIVKIKIAESRWSDCLS